MTEEKNNIIGGLRDKVNQILTICNRVKDENSVLKAKNEDLQKQVSEKDSELKELKRQYENLKTALSLMDSSEVHNTKIKLNRIVRDIEKCMSLLNN